ncbi:uncharacterized protein EV420DRAFT_1554265 [Desarmillaria tabescens]|uniref:Uncharacterized protein n=1 Tax=Armillaria tabescens TaxID=1929756 RepID=A0AA39N320_ARMTA|nr:uncharacterized protein EV420DRAFT_1554265 [Desarmillaria tabescens]KAK0455554.1 hypothetical protein EV420DRAFT_1554265 [Desarmillaria tabescens]
MRGKPAPDILVATRELLGRDAGEPRLASGDQISERQKGLVFEDGFVGVQAGKASGNERTVHSYTLSTKYRY